MPHTIATPARFDTRRDGLRIGVGLPTRVGRVSPAVVLEWAVRADAGPFSSLAVTDRVVYPAMEPLVTLAATAGVTRRVRLLTSVIIGPTRETTLLARQAASIDALTGGRLTLGIGVGVREDDYDVTGSSFQTRGRRLDEQLPALRRIWSGDGGTGGDGPGERDGSAGVPIGLPPARAGGPEVLVGGYVPAVARRIAAWADGYMAPGGGDGARLVERWAEIRAAWTAAGREGRPRLVTGSYFALGPNAEEAARAHIESWYGFDPQLAARRLSGIPVTPDAVRAAIDRQAQFGADEFILRPCSADLDSLDRLADLVAAVAPA